MKTNFSKINISRLFIGVGYSVWAATKVSFIICLIMLVAFATKTPFTELIGGFISGLLVLSIIGAVISFFVSLVVGIPITVLLIKTGLDDYLISAFIGSLIVALFFLYQGETQNHVLFFMIYGFFCAGGFMRGYKNNESR